MERIIRGWNFVRVLRLVLGAAVLVQAALMKEWPLALAGLLLAVMALANIGCCGVSQCGINPVQNKAGQNSKNDISYEELDHQK